MFCKNQAVKRLLAFCVCMLVLCVSICFSAYILINAYSSQYIVKHLQDLETVTIQKIMVLGAQVYSDGTVSPLLRQRLDKAKEAYLYLQQSELQEQRLNCVDCDPSKCKTKRVKKKRNLQIILSGSKDGDYDEPEAMANYLTAQGVAAKALLLDKKGINTYHSCRNYQSKYENETLLIVTSDYHLQRSCYLARHFSIKAYGLAANSRNFSLQTQIYNFLREALSRIKAVINVNISPNFAN